MKEKATTANAPQAPKTTEEILASLETLSDAKTVIKEQADRISFIFLK
jgi:hypothetical protein